MQLSSNQLLYSHGSLNAFKREMAALFSSVPLLRRVRSGAFWQRLSLFNTYTFRRLPASSKCKSLSFLQRVQEEGKRFGLVTPASYANYGGFNETSSYLCKCIGSAQGLHSFGARLDETKVIAVDRSGLCELKEQCNNKASWNESPLLKHIKALIQFGGGPISVAHYMEEVLTNPTAGFYLRQDAFGTAGSFITSPDISQMFGEGTAKFTDFSKALSVHLVECSPSLRQLQHEALHCSSSDKVPFSVATCEPDQTVDISAISGSPVSWHLELGQVPRGVPTIIIAHEFFDALPIHQFQKTSRGWCEKLVDLAEDPREQLRFVLSREPTVACSMFLAKRLKWSSMEERQKHTEIEVCPGALKLAYDITRRVGEDDGAALIIDYGEDGIVSDSLQAIKKHQFVNVLEEPGTADLSAYVDFAAVKHAVSGAAAGALAYGPISQSQFLGRLGINFRLEALLQNASEEQAEALQQGYWRLVGHGPAPWLEEDDTRPLVMGMGSRYKALAIVNPKHGPPVCFD